MHIGLVIRHLIGRNGEELGTAELANALVGRGVGVTVLSAGPVRPAEGDRFEAVDLGIGPLKTTGACEDFARAVGEEAGRRSVDLVHSMGPTVRCDLYQPRGGTVAETYARYGAMPRERLDRWRVALRLRFSPSIRAKLKREREFFARRPRPLMIAMSHYVARQLWHHYGVPPEHVHTVFGAVRAHQAAPEQRAAWRRKLREKLGVAEEVTLLLFVAEQFEQGGLRFLIEALRRAERARVEPSPRLVLAVIGRDDARPYQQQADDLGVRSPIHCLGPLDRDLTRRYYATADVLVLPTIFDSCSRTVLEALAMGTPAITTEHNGAGELVDKHGAGEVIHSAWAIEELARAIVRSTEAARREQWSSAAAGLADYVSVDRMVDEMLLLYSEVLAARGRPGACPGSGGAGGTAGEPDE